MHSSVRIFVTRAINITNPRVKMLENTTDTLNTKMYCNRSIKYVFVNLGWAMSEHVILLAL